MLVNEINCNIIKNKNNKLTQNKKLGKRLFCPEYSINTEERKLFPKQIYGDVFVLYWATTKEGELYSSIIPVDSNLIYFDEIIHGQKTQLHTHDYIELAYVMKGTLKQKILGKNIIFKEGELVLIDKNCIHQDYIFEEDTNILFIGMSNEMFDDIMLSKINEEKISDFLKKALLKQKNTLQYLHFCPKSIENSKKLEEDLFILIKELGKNDYPSKYITKGIMMRILSFLSTEYVFSLSVEQKNEMTSYILEEIKDYIQQNYTTISIKDLCAKFHFSEDYFNRILKQQEGITYSEYVQNIRLKESVKLLLNTNESIENISRAVGYQNKGYFYKIFLAKYGVTPANYRKAVKIK